MGFFHDGSLFAGVIEAPEKAGRRPQFWRCADEKGRKNDALADALFGAGVPV
jgi:hypothetical protein